MSAFSPSMPTGLTRLVAVAANTTVTLLAGYVVERVYIKNNTANAITGGVRIGTTNGGVDVVLALAVGASAMVDTAPLISCLSSADQTLYIQTVTAWNSANVDVVLKLTKVF